MNEFHRQLTQTIRDVGQELIDNAEDISDTNPMLSRMTITIDFDPELNMRTPTITVDKEYLCKRAIDRLREKCGLGGESDDLGA